MVKLEERERKQQVVSGGAYKRDWLGPYQTYILYLWQIAEVFDFVNAILQKIAPAMALDGDIVPGAGGSNRGNEYRNRKREREIVDAQATRDENKKLQTMLERSMEANTDAMFHNNIAYMTAQINELKRDLGSWGYQERGVPQEWINEKIEQIEDLNEAISAQTTERAAYRSRIAVRNTAARGDSSVSAGSDE